MSRCCVPLTTDTTVVFYMFPHDSFRARKGIVPARSIGIMNILFLKLDSVLVCDPDRDGISP